MKKILLSVLLISSMLTASMIPVCAAQTYTLNVGETKTLYPTSIIGKNIKSGAWISNQPFNVKITSYTGSTTRCVIEAENPTVGSKAVVQFTYYYYITSGTFTYLASGCEDFYIIVNSLEPTEVTIPSSVKFEGFEEVKKTINDISSNPEQSTNYDNIYSSDYEDEDECGYEDETLYKEDGYEDEYENEDLLENADEDKCKYEDLCEDYVDEYVYSETYRYIDDDEYEDEYCKVRFDSMGGSKVDSIRVKYNRCILEPDEPVKKGYIFAGWYCDDEFEEEFDFSRKIKKSMTLYADWVKISKRRQMILTIGKKEAEVFGKTLVNDVAPIIRKNRTMLPARFVAENLDADVEWSGKCGGVVIITKDDIEIVIYIGSNEAYVNGEEVILDCPAFIEKDRTYTPLRFIAENLGAYVEWDEDSKEVIIIK